MSLGAALAGIDVQFAVEIDKFAAKTYSANHPKTILHHGDVRAVSRRTLRPWLTKNSDLVVFGGPPCQGFSWSNARTRNTRNGANWLFEEFVRLVGLLKPAWVVFENVQGIVNTSEGLFVARLSSSLENLGYTIAAARLNASDFGVPQDRTRFFLVGSKKNLRFDFPAPLADRLTVDDAIRDLPKLENGNTDCFLHYGRAQPSEYGRQLRQGLIGCSNHVVTRNAPFVLKRYHYVPPGGNWENIPPRLMKNYADRTRCHTGIYHRLRPNHPSIVIGNFRKNMLIHPTQCRGLSVREAARIQSFPDAYIFHGSIGFQQQQVGNAVPPYLARALFKALLS